jgi:hypothetical protein
VPPQVTSGTRSRYQSIRMCQELAALQRQHAEIETRANEWR